MSPRCRPPAGNGCAFSPRPLGQVSGLDCTLFTVEDLGLLSAERLHFMCLDFLLCWNVLSSLKSHSSFPEHGAQVSAFLCFLFFFYDFLKFYLFLMEG